MGRNLSAQGEALPLLYGLPPSIIVNTITHLQPPINEKGDP